MNKIDWSFWIPVTIFGMGIAAILILAINSSKFSEERKKQFMQCVALNGTLVEGRHMNLCVTGIIPMEDK
jgi:hypothetical protein